MVHPSAGPMTLEMPLEKNSPDERPDGPSEADMQLNDNIPTGPVDQQRSEDFGAHSVSESNLNADEPRFRQFHPTENYTCPDIRCQNLRTSFVSLEDFLRHLDQNHSGILDRIRFYRRRLEPFIPLGLPPPNSPSVHIPLRMIDHLNDFSDPDWHITPTSGQGPPTDPMNYRRQPRAESNSVFIPSDATYEAHSVRAKSNSVFIPSDTYESHSARAKSNSVYIPNDDNYESHPRAKSNSVFIPNDITYGSHSVRAKSNSIFIPNDYPALDAFTDDGSAYTDETLRRFAPLNLQLRGARGDLIQPEDMPQDIQRFSTSPMLGRRRSTDIIIPDLSP